MEMELKGLIEKIKKDGVQEAEKKAQDIIQQAEQKAKAIVNDAENQSKIIIQKAQQEADKFKKMADESIRQSVRDVLLMLKQKIVGIFDTVLKRGISKEMGISALGECIIKLIEGFRKEEKLDIEVLLNKKDKDNVEKAIIRALTDEMRKGVTVKISPEIESGFRIGRKGENYYYDFTDEAVAEAFRQYLNPKLIKVLDNSKGS